MSKISFLVLFVPMLPLLGAFWNRLGAMILSGVAWAVFLGMLMNVLGSPLHWVFAAQIPFLMLMTVASILKAKKAGVDEAADLKTVDEADWQALQNRHKSLKEAVSWGEKEEAQSLQIYGAAKGLAGALSWKDMAPQLTTSIQKIFGGYEFLLFAIDANGRRRLLHRRGGWSREFPLNGDIQTSCVFVDPQEASEVVPLLSVPIYSGQGEGKRMNGILIMKAPGGDRTEKELIEAGREFGEQLGMAIEKALLFSQMEMQSLEDGLTRVLRRQAFMERLEEEFKRAAVFHTPFSLLMVDIDYFKSVNDSHGHEAGDAVLRRIGELLKESIYETDVAGRYGGEEFVLLMPRAQRDGVLRKAEQIRQKIEGDVVPFGFERLKVTVSIGVAHCPQSGRSGERLIASADAAMYRAKEQGRNRVVES